MRMKPGLALATMILAMAVLLACCTDQTAPVPGQVTTEKRVVIGAMPFNEQYILSEMLALLLEQEGYKVEVKSGLQNAILYEGVRRGEIDGYIEYTSAAYYFIPTPPSLDRWDPDAVYSAVRNGTMRDGIVLAGRTGFHNDNQIAVPAGWASARNITTISGLAPYAKDMVFGSDLVFHEAEDGLPRLENVYGFRWRDVKPMDPALTFEAIRSGQVDAIVTYTTDTRIDLFNLTILDDDRAALPPYEAIILVNGARATDPRFLSTVSLLVERINSSTMRGLNAEFDLEKEDAEDIARRFLQQQGLIS